MPDISQINIPNNDGSMTYNIKDANVPHSSLPAVSGGTDLSLVTTGEKADWIDKTKIYQVEGTKRTSTVGDWAGVIDVPALYDGLLMLYLAPEDTYYDNKEGTIILRLTLSDGTITDMENVFGLNLINVCIGQWYLFRFGQSEIVSGWYYVNGLSYEGNAVSQSKASTYILDQREFPILLSQKVVDENTSVVLSKAYFSYPFRYSASQGNLIVPKVNGYILNNACAKDVDNEVEQSSDNLPTSDAVYNAINNIHIQTKTASGAIATFNDASGDVPFATLKSDINPVQDLHGYSKPWIGGVGKNLLNYEAWKTTSITRGTAVWENNGVTLTATANDCYTLTSTDAKIPMSEGETITLSWEETTNKTGQIFIFPNGTTTGMVTVNNRAVKKATYTATSGITFVTFRFGVANSGDTIAYKNIQIEKGSQVTSWEPYSNICPISGFSALNVTRSGVNLWDEQWELGGIGPDGNNIANTDRIRSKNFIPVKPNLSVFISYSDSRTVNFYVCEYDINKTFIQRTISNKNTVFTTSANCCFIRFFVYSAVNPVTTYNNDISINYPSSDTEYHAYNGQTATVNFGQTVYGGVADVTNGKVTATYSQSIKLSDIVGWSYDSTYQYFYTTIADKKSGNINLLCECYSVVDKASATQLLNGEMKGHSSSRNVYIKDTNYTDVTNWLNAVGNNRLVYEVATPIEITTTPENLSALSGQTNNVYSDTNGDTTVEYFSGDCDGVIKLLKILNVI